MITAAAVGDIVHLLLAGRAYDNIPLWQVQYRFVDAANNGKLLHWPGMAVMTWVMLDDAGLERLHDNDVIGGADWVNDQGELWIIDLVAPYGSVGKIVREARRYFGERYGDGVNAQWRRPWRKPYAKMGAAIARVS